MVGLLLAHGAKVDLKDKIGRTALNFAQDFRHTKVIAILKRVGAK